MSLFKRSNKNKSASAASTPASTPAQTPRASMQTIRDSGIKMTPEEALYKISQNMMTNASTDKPLGTRPSALLGIIDVRVFGESTSDRSVGCRRSGGVELLSSFGKEFVMGEVDGSHQVV
ncbi:MAG: hypothetical protein J3R72DRAFT_527416 [Linnemannia gamsii]|nr:MAG: hypothetical protein J3R72DRAFT_527416 [Linnemannia gamsii]